MHLRLFFLSIIIALAFLASCASTDSTTEKTGVFCQGNDLYIQKDMIEGAPNYNPKLANSVYVLPKSVLKQIAQNKAFDAKGLNQYKLNKVKIGQYKNNYYVGKKLCSIKDSSYLVQLNPKGEPMITILQASYPFLTDLNQTEPLAEAEPTVVEAEEPTTKTNISEMISGPIRTQPWVIRAAYFQDSSHAKYLAKNKIKVSWDLADQVRQVLQYSGSENLGPIIFNLNKGEDYVMLDPLDGKYFQLVVEYPTGVRYFTDDHATDFHNVALVKNYKKSPDKVFEIMLSSTPLLTQDQNDKKGVGQAVTTKPVKKHYTRREKYPNGWYYMETSLVLDKDEGFFTHLANARDIITINENGQKVIKNEYVLVGANYLEKWSPNLYNEYKDKDRFVNKAVSLKDYPDKK
ncbi:MAG: hypothetical protein V1765_00210 [bacterium]